MGATAGKGDRREVAVVDVGGGEDVGDGGGDPVVDGLEHGADFSSRQGCGVGAGRGARRRSDRCCEALFGELCGQQERIPLWTVTVVGGSQPLGGADLAVEQALANERLLGTFAFNSPDRDRPRLARSSSWSWRSRSLCGVASYRWSRDGAGSRCERSARSRGRELAVRDEPTGLRLTGRGANIQLAGRGNCRRGRVGGRVGARAGGEVQRRRGGANLDVRTR